MSDYQHPLAVVTGASSGIGLELAGQFAAHGYDLLISAEDDGIERVATQLRQSGATVQTAQADLRAFDGVEQLYGAICAVGRPVEAVALNAGVGSGGAFVQTDLIDELEIISVNLAATVHLAKRLLPAMMGRRRGKILITSSIASTMPLPAVYNASASFLQSFVAALQDELEDTGSRSPR
jgi:short-subunit dehydrogenase